MPPLLTRAGRTLGARGWQLYREVIFPAALPGYVAGLDQAWGFAWKALMAGELITAGLRAAGLGQLLQRSQDDVPMLVATVAVIVVIGVAVEYLIFGTSTDGSGADVGCWSTRDPGRPRAGPRASARCGSGCSRACGTR